MTARERYLASFAHKLPDRITLCGTGSLQHTLPFGTPEDVEREVKWCIDVASPGGGYFLACSSMVGPEIPVDNALMMYEAARKYGVLEKTT